MVGICSVKGNPLDDGSELERDSPLDVCIIVGGGSSWGSSFSVLSALSPATDDAQRFRDMSDESSIAFGSREAEDDEYDERLLICCGPTSIADAVDTFVIALVSGPMPECESGEDCEEDEGPRPSAICKAATRSATSRTFFFSTSTICCASVVEPILQA